MIPLIPNPKCNKSLDNSTKLTFVKAEFRFYPCLPQISFFRPRYASYTASAAATDAHNRLSSFCTCFPGISSSRSGTILPPLQGVSHAKIFVVPVECPPTPPLSPGAVCSAFHLTFLHYNLHMGFALPSLLESKS